MPRRNLRKVEYKHRRNRRTERHRTECSAGSRVQSGTVCVSVETRVRRTALCACAARTTNQRRIFRATLFAAAIAVFRFKSFECGRLKKKGSLITKRRDQADKAVQCFLLLVSSLPVLIFVVVTTGNRNNFYSW